MKNKLLLVTLVVFLVISWIVFLGFYLSKSSIHGKAIEDPFIGEKFVTKIIDGDTIIIEGESVRLLGIDADERTYLCYATAKEKIEELVLNKEVILEGDGENKDQYGRYLRYIFIDRENINLKLVEEGFAVARFSPQNTKYKEEILAAEKYARESKIGCKWGEQEPIIKESPKILPEPKESKQDLDVIGACNAGNYIGQEKTVEGKVVDAYKYKASSVFLNFEKPYPNSCFTAVIWSSDWEKFPENPEEYYLEKTVKVKGKIIEYKGALEIILKDLSQIEII